LAGGIERQGEGQNVQQARRRTSLDQALKVCRATGVTLHWIYRGLMSGLPVDLATAAPRGGAWNAISVMRAMKRLGIAGK
jgi:hypothetical protein